MSGREIIAAAAKGSAWGTAVACGAGDGILILSESIQGGPEYERDESLQTWPLSGDLGAKSYEGDIEAYMRYRGLGVLIALAMGTAGTPAQQGATAAYLHTLQLATEIDDLFASLAIDKGHSVWEYPSAKVEGFTLKGEAGKPVTITFHLVCDDLNRNTTTGTNTNTTMASVTVPDTGNRVLMRQGVFRINTQAGDALDSDDTVYPSSFELTFKRKMARDHVSGSDAIAEPVDDGFPEIRLKLDFPRYSVDTYLDAWVNETYQKADVSFSGGVADGAYNYEFNLYFPNLKCINAEAAVDGAGKIVHPLEFDCLGASSAPNGMTGVTEPFEVQIQNTLTTNLLA